MILLKSHQNTKLLHPVGIVIPGKFEVGEHIQLNQNITIGMSEEGHPTIENNSKVLSSVVVQMMLRLERGLL